MLGVPDNHSGVLQVLVGNKDKIQQDVCAKVMNFRIIEYLKLEETQKDHRIEHNSLIPSLTIVSGLVCLIINDRNL